MGLIIDLGYGVYLRPVIEEDGTFEIIEFILYILFAFVLFWGILFYSAFKNIMNLTWKSKCALFVSFIWWILLGLELINYYNL